MFQNHQNGDVAEMKVAADLIERGFRVSKPLVENSPYDLISEIDGSLDRIQVKHSRLTNGVIEAQFRRKTIKKSEISREQNTEFDIASIYCPDNGQCYYVPITDFNQNLSLRVSSERNMSSIRWASEYENYPS